MPDALYSADNPPPLPKSIASGGGLYSADNPPPLPKSVAAPAAMPQGYEVDPISGAPFTPEVQKQQRQDSGDVLRGAGLQITGLGELVPGLHSPAARASQNLQSGIKNQTLANVGGLGEQAAELAFPIGFGAKLIKPAAEGAGWLARGARGFLQGAAGGGVGGAISGAQQPTGQEDYGKSLKEKTSGAIEGAALGAATGGTLSAGGSLVKSSGGLLKTARGKELDASARDLTGRVGGELKPAAAEQAAEAGKIPVRQAVVEHLNERVALAEKAAKDMGLKADEAKALVEHTHAEVQNRQIAADSIAQEMAANPRMSHADLAGRIQTKVDELIAKDKETREAASGITQVLKADGGRPSVPTDAVAKQIAGLEKVSNNSTAERLFAEIRNRLSTTESTPGVSEGGKTVVQTPALSLERANGLRQYIDAVLDGKDKVDGIGADKVLVHNLQGIRESLNDAMEKSSTAYKNAMRNFRTFSNRINALSNGPLKGALQETRYGGDYVKERGAVLTALLNKTEQGNSAINELLKADPSLKDNIRQYLNGELRGMQEGAPNPTGESVRKLMDQYDEVLKRTGLDKEFEVMRGKLAGAEGQVAQAKDAEAKAGDFATMRGRVATDAKQAISKETDLRAQALDRLRDSEKAQVLQRKYTDKLDKLSSANTTPESGVKMVEDITKLLRDNEKLTDAQKYEFDEQARKIISQYSDKATAIQRLRAIAIAAATATAAAAEVRGSEAISGVNLFLPHGRTH